MKVTKYLVTDIMFDFEDSQGELDKEDQIEICQDTLGIWEAEDEDELVDKISDRIRWCVQSINYTTNLLHPLTSYL